MDPPLAVPHAPMPVPQSPTPPDAASAALLRARAEVEAERGRSRRLADALRQERATSERLRELDRIRRELLLAVSHDLQGPLTAIAGLERILAAGAGGANPARLEELARALRANAARVEFVQANLVDLHRLADREVAVARRETPLLPLVETAVSAADLQDHQVRVDARGSASIDPAFAGRILDNLLNNASRHAPAGTSVEVSATRHHDEGALLTVADHGPGIPEHLRTAVFEGFVAGPTRPGAGPRRPGMGIGLHIVSRFAEAHGGRAWIDETPGGGATVNIRLAPAGGG